MNKFEDNFEVNQNLDINEIFNNAEPNVISIFSPENSNEAKSEFLNNDELNFPNNSYDKLNKESIGELYSNISKAVLAIENDNSLGKIEREMYSSKLEICAKNTKMLEAAYHFRNSKNSENQQESAYIFMKNNIEVYGEPERDTFESLLSEKMLKIKQLNLSGEGKKIRDDLEDMLGQSKFSTENNQRFRPKNETIQDFSNIIRDLYSKQLSFIPEKEDGEKYSAKEIFDVFENILNDFEKDGFSKFEVNWKDSGAITVSAKEKKIFIPKNRPDVSKSKLEGLIVHEIGTHYMRAQMGEKYGNLALKLGLNGYMDTEEGIARAMEMAVMGEYQEAGIQHYITSGLVYFKHMNFREAFEVNWRLGILDGKNNFSKENIDKKREIAFKNTQRILRGTEELPWFKDLSYFNGSQKVWKYIEDNIDSPMLIDDLLLGGKNNILNQDQQRQIYELKVGKI